MPRRLRPFPGPARLRSVAIALAVLSLAAVPVAPPWLAAALLGVDAAALLLLGWRSPAQPPAPAPALPHRLLPHHPVSGLPMREALLARVEADAAGTLGIIAFADFERLTAFDPAMGERVFAAVVARLRRMLTPTRLAAQIDRGTVGVWFAHAAPEETRAELDAIVYALGQPIELDATTVVPETRLRVAAFDRAEGVAADAFVSRTLASFALPEGPAAVTASAAPADAARERYALEQDLRQAVARRELRLDYQPLVDAGQGRVAGAEALIRWDHATLGPVSPGRFVPLMEAIGLSDEIGLWALNAALREAGRWAAEGLDGLRVAVNVSARQLERDDLPLLVGRTLRRHALAPAALEIELTESVATSDTGHCRRLFARLREMGVALAVDDFGTGYSGFSSLRQLTFDKIKIDREFVTDVDRRRDSQAICHSIVALGRGLGMRVLAEGVERAGEYEWLRHHGCQHFQGYYFAPPLAGDDFRRFVRDRGQLARLLRPDAATDERLRA